MTEGKYGLEKLQGKTSVREILEVAIGFEESARDFYSALIPKVSKRIRYLFEDLAAEEQRHYDLFKSLSERPDLAEQIKTMIDRPAEDSKFSDRMHLDDLTDPSDDQAVLQYAMGREHAAMSHYRELATTAPEGSIRDLFAFLTGEETRHKLELEKLYYEIVYRGA